MRAQSSLIAAALTFMIAALTPGAHSPQANDTPPSPSSAETKSPPKRTPAEIAALRDSAMNRVLKGIAGRENAPAESVFKDVRVLKGVPAGRFLRIMNLGFGGSLGVACGHCHVPGKWESEEKKEKQIARDMWMMTQTINKDLLAKIQNLDDDNRVVNCTTCHRGEVTPALTLPAH